MKAWKEYLYHFCKIHNNFTLFSKRIKIIRISPPPTNEKKNERSAIGAEHCFNQEISEEFSFVCFHTK